MTAPQNQHLEYSLFMPCFVSCSRVEASARAARSTSPDFFPDARLSVGCVLAWIFCRASLHFRFDFEIVVHSGVGHAVFVLALMLVLPPLLCRPLWGHLLVHKTSVSPHLLLLLLLIIIIINGHSAPEVEKVLPETWQFPKAASNTAMPRVSALKHRPFVVQPRPVGLDIKPQNSPT